MFNSTFDTMALDRPRINIEIFDNICPDLGSKINFECCSDLTELFKIVNNFILLGAEYERNLSNNCTDEYIIEHRLIFRKMSAMFDYYCRILRERCNTKIESHLELVLIISQKIIKKWFTPNLRDPISHCFLTHDPVTNTLWYE